MTIVQNPSEVINNPSIIEHVRNHFMFSKWLIKHRPIKEEEELEKDLEAKKLENQEENQKKKNGKTNFIKGFQ